MLQTIPISVLRALVYLRRAYQTAKPAIEVAGTINRADTIYKMTKQALNSLLHEHSHEQEDAAAFLTLYGAAVLRELEATHLKIKVAYPGRSIAAIASVDVKSFMDELPLLTTQIRGSSTLSDYYHRWIDLYAGAIEKKFGSSFFYALDAFNGADGETIKADNFYSLWAAHLGSVTSDVSLLNDIKDVIFQSFKDKTMTEDEGSVAANAKLNLIINTLKKIISTEDGLFLESTKPKEAPNRSSYVISVIKDKLRDGDTTRFASFVSSPQKGDISIPPPLTAIVRKRNYRDMRKGRIILPPLQLVEVEIKKPLKK